MCLLCLMDAGYSMYVCCPSPCCLARTRAYTCIRSHSHTYEHNTPHRTPLHTTRTECGWCTACCCGWGQSRDTHTSASSVRASVHACVCVRACMCAAHAHTRSGPTHHTICGHTNACRPSICGQVIAGAGAITRRKASGQQPRGMNAMRNASHLFCESHCALYVVRYGRAQDGSRTKQIKFVHFTADDSEE